MKNIFQKIPVEIPKPFIHKKKCQLLLHPIGGDWYMNELNEKLSHLKKQKPSKNAQGEGDEIKINLQVANQNWNDWKFQIHWNKT